MPQRQLIPMRQIHRGADRNLARSLRATFVGGVAIGTASATRTPFAMHAPCGPIDPKHIT